MTDTPRPGASDPSTALGQDRAAAQSASLSPDERNLVRSAAIMAGVLVSQAESGFFDTFKESFAASKAVKSAPAGVRELLVQGGLPTMPRAGTKDELATATLDSLRQAVATLRAKAPGLVEDYRATVLASCRDVAAAADDTSASESEAMARVEQALA
ncbi:hypothetical protein [Intrasporangium sp. DVR]|uniref:hypothetical protein n=1 Tax=Intrasporangium sp. DVR TaxID=3127867 RepID=UPI00313A578B